MTAPYESPCPCTDFPLPVRAKHANGGIQFIRAELLGAAPLNRSGLGVSGFHIHEVVQGIKTDGLSRRRYRDAAVVKVPAGEVSKIKARFGGTVYSEKDMTNFFNFAIRVPTGLLENLCQVHFAVIPAALLKVRPTTSARGLPGFGHRAAEE